MRLNNTPPITINRFNLPEAEAKVGKAIRLQTQPIQFGAISPGMIGPLINVNNAAMSTLANNPLISLVASDLGGMVLPRSTIELFKRGPDAGRETFLREISGTLTNTFLGGWLGILVTSQLAKMHWFNPKAMSFKAWIDKPTMDAFQVVAQKVMQNAAEKSPQTIRQEFLDAILQNLQSTDNLSKTSKYAERLNYGRLWDRHTMPVGAPGATWQDLRDMYLRPGPQRTFHIDEMVENRFNHPMYLDQVEAAKARFLKANGLTSKTELTAELKPQFETAIAKVEQLLKFQIRRELTDIARMPSEETFIKGLTDKAAKEGFLTSEASLLNPFEEGKFLIGRKPTKDILSMLKYYMEEHINRALTEAEAAIKAGQAEGNLGEVAYKILTEKGFIQEASVESKFLGKLLGSLKGLLRPILPSLEDGLMPYAIKSKLFLTIIPIVMAGIFGCSMVLINNEITRRKYGGKTFFPGEEALRQQLQGESQS